MAVSYSILLYSIKWENHQVELHVVCTAPYTTTQMKSNQQTRVCQPNGWSQQMCFAMPAWNDIFPSVKDKDMQPYTCSHIPCLYKAMPAHIDILLTSANNQLGRIISPPLSRGVLLSVVQGVWCLFDSEVDCLRWLACLCLYSIMNTCKDLKIKLSWNWISENPLDLQDSKHPQSILAYYLLPLCTKCMEPYKQWCRQPYCLMTRSAQPHVYMHMFCFYVISILYQLLDEY
jgi:hypothetical protein